MTSKRGVFGGNGPSSQNGVSGSGVHPVAERLQARERDGARRRARPARAADARRGGRRGRSLQQFSHRDRVAVGGDVARTRAARRARRGPRKCAAALSSADVDGKRIDHADSAFARTTRARASSSARATPRRRNAGSMTKHRTTAASCAGTSIGVGGTSSRAKQCGSLCRGCAFSQPTTRSASSCARKPSISPTSMRAPIAVRFASASSDDQSSAVAAWKK